MIEKLTGRPDHRAFIESFIHDPVFSDPHLSHMIDEGEDVSELGTGRDEHYFRISKGDVTTGLFVFLIIPDENYIEMLTGLTRDPDALEEMLTCIGKNYPGYRADFVFNPRNPLIDAALRARGAEFDTEQQKMIFTHVVPDCGTDGVELLSPRYEKDYIAMHSTDVYWTGERVIAAPDRFKAYVAIEDGEVAGYLDVTCKYDDNEPFDLLVKPEYRRRGHGRKLLARALIDNEPHGMILFVDVDNLPAIKLYESSGFVVMENRNSRTANWFIEK